MRHASSWLIGAAVGTGLINVATARASGDSPCSGCVTVALDLDPDLPGFQTTRLLSEGISVVPGVTVWIFDPAGTATLYDIGYIGGLNRGISFGHSPAAGNAGEVVEITASSVAPVIPGHTAFVNGGIMPLFAGPEVQYFEDGAGPGVISADPPAPVLTLDIVLNGATAGDVFHFHLGDMTAVAFQPFLGGAFSSQGDHTLDSGGDACPDGTVTAYGIDPDAAAPSPPAAFCVDYRDSPPEGGGATIVVVAPAVPAVSAWGCAILASILLAAGSLAVRRRRVA